MPDPLLAKIDRDDMPMRFRHRWDRAMQDRGEAGCPIARPAASAAA